MLVGACAQILGVDDGLPFDAAGEGSDAGEVHDARDAAPDRTIDSRAGSADVRQEARSEDAGVRDARATEAGDDDVTCVRLPGFCVSRCGETVDNCNNPIQCGPCEGGLTCTAGGGAAARLNPHPSHAANKTAAHR
jgi:hypothetical protein